MHPRSIQANHISRKWALATIACLASATASAQAQDADVATLAPVMVHPPSQSDTALGQAQSRRSMSPGNVSAVPETRYEEGAVAGMHDALTSTPGVYVQNPSGQVSARISMRGSGITSPTGVRGVRMLRDGLPLARIDDMGDSIYGDPQSAELIEVLRGANAMRYGAATLGGAINLVSPTGHSQPGWRLRLDGGAYGYSNTRAQWGDDFGNGWDAFAAASSSRSDGAREQSSYTVNRFYGNVGYALSPTSRGRLHYTQEYFRVDLPGAITREQLEEDSHAANIQAVQANARIRTQPRWRIAYVHEWDLGSRDHLSIGAYHTGTRYRSWGTASDSRYEAIDYGLVLRHELHGSLAGRESRFSWGVNLGQGRDDNAATSPAMRASPLLPAAGSPLASLAGQRSNIEAHAQWSWRAAPRWSVILGGHAVRARRTADNRVVPLAQALFADGSASATYTGFNPHAGFIWDMAPDAQIFGNLSGSFEPPNSIYFHAPGGELKAQRATTLELGSRGGTRQFGWEASVYYTRVRNEIVETPLQGMPGMSAAHNADKTRHLGLELGLSGEYGLAGLGVPGRLDWGLAYTWNDFRFEDDRAFGGNRLPGIPDHVMRLDLRYRHPSGFYLGPTLELASGWNVDQANTLRAPGYGIVHASAGYQSPDGRLRLYLDLRNLANRHYAAATEYTIDASGRGDPAVYIPGASRMLFAGVEWRW